MNAAIYALAEYFTGSNVTYFSLRRATGNDHQADNFFKTRDALGLRGYPSVTEAAQTIKDALK
jgi:hypothetical protein